RRELAWSVGWFPLVGFFLGGLLAGGDLLLAPWLPPLARSALVVVALAVLTGGLHLDGLADMVDALAGGRGVEERLQILRDSRTGALGAAAVAASLLLKTAALAELPGELRWRALWAVPALSRWVAALLCGWAPLARGREGLGAAFAEGVRWPQLFLATALCGLGGAWLLGWALVALMVALALAAGLYRSLLIRTLGGATGDAYGAATEAAEVALLLAFLIGGRLGRG
ncbi:MAG: adenosylcobinamide-GDP ribazoletransferase, partial [Nitrospinota bacterium]